MGILWNCLFLSCILHSGRGPHSMQQLAAVSLQAQVEEQCCIHRKQCCGAVISHGSQGLPRLGFNEMQHLLRCRAGSESVDWPDCTISAVTRRHLQSTFSA